MKKSFSFFTGYICLVLFIIASPGTSTGQSLTDSVIIYIDNRVEVSIALSDYADLQSSGQIASTLADFQSKISMLENQLTYATAEMIRFEIGGNVVIDEGIQEIIYINKDGTLTPTGLRDKAILFGEEFQINITASDILNITEISIIDCLEKGSAALPQKSRWSKSLYYECNNGSVNLLEEKNNELDFLELKVGAGVGQVKQSWVPDISMGIGIGFSNKGKVSFPYVSSNLLFNFDAEDNMNINTFLNLGYGWDINKQLEKKEMLSFELGYLVNKQGNLFGENTFKFGANWSPVKGVFVNPHLYLTDNFNRIFPGVRVGFGF